MGAGEESSPAKSSKPTASTQVSTQQQEAPTAPSFPDWSASMQAYYGGAGATPPPFFASPIASPAPHPYLWGSQHPMVGPYGTPLPYPALYPHGGLYAHPNMAMGSPLTSTGAEEREPDGRDEGLMKKSNGASGNRGLTGGKSGESGKATSGSGHDVASQSDESASEGSSEASDENVNHQASSATKKRNFNQMLADVGNAKTLNAAQFNGDNPSTSVPGKPAMPTTNLNIGMDLWSGSKPSKIRPNASVALDSATMVVREGSLRDQHWVQDDRELKREKRKQSNRESARRSRLRKQAECEDLQVKVDKLSNENQTLREEVQKLADECEKITSENNSIMEELTCLYGPDAISNLQFVNGRDNSHELDTSTENNSNSLSGQNGQFNSNGKHDS